MSKDYMLEEVVGKLVTLYLNTTEDGPEYDELLKAVHDANEYMGY